MLDQLVNERYARLLSYARLMTNSREDAEDAVHDALISVFSRHRRFDGIDACEGYVRRAIASRAIDEHRRRGRERKALVTLRSDADQLLESIEWQLAEGSALHQALARLTPRERACVTMRFVDQLTVDETARALSLATGSVKRYVYDGIAKLNFYLGTQQDDAEPVPVLEQGGRRW